MDGVGLMYAIARPSIFRVASMDNDRTDSLSHLS